MRPPRRAARDIGVRHGVTRLRDLTIGQKRALWAWAFLAVPVVFFVGIRFYPAVEAFRASFTNWNIVGKMEWIGVANYTRLAQDAVFWKVVVLPCWETAAGFSASAG